jgi:predicted porin
MSAFAQSTVTLYGVIDEGFNYTNNAAGNSAYQLESGYAMGSRWGIKGKEDLGGGLAAIATLENGFDVNSGRLGQGGRMFGRQAYVGLSSTTFGSITAGRQYDSVVDYVGQTSVTGSWGGYIFAHPYDNDNLSNSFRVNNSIKYASPSVGGFSAGGLYGFSNAAGGFSNNRTWSVGGQYAFGPFLAAAAYLSATNPGLTAGGAQATDDANFSGSNLRIIAAGLTYTVSSATFGFSYGNTYVSNPAATAYLSGSLSPAGGTTSSLRFSNYEVNAKWQFTPAFYVGGMYSYTDGTFDGSNGKRKPKWHQIGVMADYYLSKRTDIYLQGVYQKRAGDDTGTVLDTAYVAGATDASSNNHQILTRVALRHLF